MRRMRSFTRNCTKSTLKESHSRFFRNWFWCFTLLCIFPPITVTFSSDFHIQGWENERVISKNSTESGRIILVLDGDPPAHKKRVNIYSNWKRKRHPPVLFLFTQIDCFEKLPHLRVELLISFMRIAIDGLSQISATFCWNPFPTPRYSNIFGPLFMSWWRCLISFSGWKGFADDRCWFRQLWKPDP